MREVNIISLLKETSAETLVAVILSCIISIFYKKSHKLSIKLFLLLSFVIGGACCCVLTLIIGEKVSFAEVLKSGVVAGALSVTVTVFVKKLAFVDGDDVKKSLEKLLSSIVISDNLDKIVDEIIEKLSKNDAVCTKETLKQVLLDNGFSSDDEVLETVCLFIMNALNSQDDKTE